MSHFFCPPGIYFHTSAFSQMRFSSGAIYFIHFKTLYKHYILYVSLCTFFGFSQHYILRCLHVGTYISHSPICHCSIIFHSMTILPYRSVFLAVDTGWGNRITESVPQSSPRSRHQDRIRCARELLEKLVNGVSRSRQGESADHDTGLTHVHGEWGGRRIESEGFLLLI